MIHTKRKGAVWAGIALFMCAGMYPPWVHSIHSYNWLFARAYGTARVDFTRLLVEWIMIAALMAGLYFAPIRLGFLRRFKRRKEPSHPKRWGRVPSWVVWEMNGMPPDQDLCEVSERMAYTDEEIEEYPFTVELRNGDFARFTTSEGAESFRANYPKFIKHGAEHGSKQL